MSRERSILSLTTYPRMYSTRVHVRSAPVAAVGGEQAESPYSPQAGDGLRRAGLAAPSPGVVQATARPALGA
ncbi:hypothetical protein GCM10009546_52240 [Actinomadura livida]|uniref:Uncharacterized protein n=1 Tax=Actinomadura livida TaxID=79909 RepID=A0ABN1F6A7_9ACTN|nr:hypothetical protein GCM10010208_25560 [Actinomadura livida]